MKPEANGHMLSLSLQFVLWYKVLISQFREDLSSVDWDLEDSGSKNKEGKTFQKPMVVKTAASLLHNTRSVGGYQQTRVSMRAGHPSVVETVVFFCRLKATCEEFLVRKKLKEQRKIPTDHLLWTHAINIIRHAPPEERFLPGTRKFGNSMMLRTKQKAISWTIDVAVRSDKAGEPVVDICSCTLAIGMACS